MRNLHPQRCGVPASPTDWDSCELPKGHEGGHAYIAPKCGKASPTGLATCALDWDHEGNHEGRPKIIWANDEPGRPARWWRYAVLRGDGILAWLDGCWYDLDETPEPFGEIEGYSATVEATNRWEQREDGAVAVVYEWLRR